MISDEGNALQVRTGNLTEDVSSWRTPKPDRIFANIPKIGIVVGSFAAVPYVHLHLECRRRFYPEVPLLIQDDCSPFGDPLRRLCHEYGAEFSGNVIRFPRFRGDLTAMAHGMVWCEKNGIDLLVKMSRRFVPKMKWTDGLIELAVASQYPTYSAWTSTLNFGFRTECVAFAVGEWRRLGLLDALIDLIYQPGRIHVELEVHRLARRAALFKSHMADRYDHSIGHRLPDRNGYAPWPFMGTDRAAPSRDYLWHDWATPTDYAKLAAECGLSYTSPDFADPNMGCGQSPRR